MQTRKTPKKAGVARLVRDSATKSHQVVDQLADAIRDAEEAMRASTITDMDIINRTYVPSTTLPTVEIVGEPILALAQVTGASRKRALGGKELLIAGIRADVDYAYELCQMVDKAVLAAWNAVNETGNVYCLPANARSAYRRTYQRNLCVAIREKITQMNATRLMRMKAEDRKTLAQKRDMIAGVLA